MSAATGARGTSSRSTPAPAARCRSVSSASPRQAGRLVAGILRANYEGRVRVIVVEPAPSRGMLTRKDELTPMAIADGSPQAMFGRRGPMHTLTSDTTRRDGVVSNEDVAP